MFLDVRDLTITLKTGEEIAKDISFSIDGGEMLSIVGSSGAGKTTVCKAVMGLLSSNYSISGEVLYRGENLLHCSKKRLQAIYGKEICYIMQNPMTAFNPSLRIGRQLEKTCYLHNPQISRQELQLLVSNTLQQLGLDDLKRILKSYPDALSGGMLQRIMIAAALINQPTCPTGKHGVRPAGAAAPAHPWRCRCIGPCPAGGFSGTVKSVSVCSPAGRRIAHRWERSGAGPFSARG